MWMGRIKAVEREYGAIRFGTDRLIVAVNDDPSIMLGQVERPDIATASMHLQGTYIVRLFSEFETSLQHFALAFHIRKPRGAETLVNRVRDRRASRRPTPMRSTACESTEMCWYTSDRCRSRRWPLGRRLGRYAPCRIISRISRHIWFRRWTICMKLSLLASGR